MLKLTELIQNMLPELTEEETDEVATKLNNKVGAINKKKLKYGRECDLAKVRLKPAHCSELLEVW